MSNEYIRIQYAAKPESFVYSHAVGGSKINVILLGTWAGVVQDDNGDRVRVVTAGPDGWVDRDDLRDSCGFKVFYVDVGQGDGILIETPGRRILIDGGPNSNLLRYLRGYQYSYLLKANMPVHIDTIFLSHFDADHFAGLTSLIKDKDFTFGNVYHNGIARFSSKSAQRLDGYNTDLGRMNNNVLKTTFNDIEDAENLIRQGGLQSAFRKFLEAVVKANKQGRLGSLNRLTSRNNYVSGYGAGSGLSIKVLGPVPGRSSGAIDWPWFSDSSHTRNGHSLVLKFNYSENGAGKSFLFGGDLNTDSEEYLINHYGKSNPFRVDIAKSCHHGSSEFTVDFMDKVKPFATVISSGDNESYSHPRADALGCAGRYSRGVRPLVFSTELARSVNSGGDILYGMINCRTDGRQIVMAQMKERRSGVDIWDSYVI